MAEDKKEISEENAKIIAEYEGIQKDVKALQEKVLTNVNLPMNRRIKVTQSLEHVVRHCFGCIGYLNGTYVPKDSDFKKN